MNRLIIIGNGFDLAHGLKTSVKDFGEFYFSKVFESVLDGKSFEDELIDFKVNSFKYIPQFDDTIDYNDFYTIKKSIDLKQHIDKKFKFSLMQLLYASLSSYQWFNIEDRYFKILIQDINPTYRDKIKITNDLFEVLKNKFLNYLGKENNRISNEIINAEYLTLFSKKMLNVKKGLNNISINNRNSYPFGKLHFPILRKQVVDFFGGIV